MVLSFIMEDDSALSRRGARYALPANKNQVLDILRDGWHPTDNPDGFLNLGVAENVSTPRLGLGEEPPFDALQTLMHSEMLDFIGKQVGYTPKAPTYEY